MRITHIFKATGLSGAEAHIVTLSRALHTEGFECDMIVLTEPRRPATALFEAARANGLSATAVPIAHDLDLRVVGRIVSHLRAARTQLVHTHLIHGDLYGTLAAGLLGRVVVQSRHNPDKFRRNRLLRLPMQIISAPAKTVITISDSLADFTRDIEGVPGSKIVRIHYGLDPDSTIRAATPGALRKELGLGDEPIVAAVGRLTEQKGFRYLIEAWERVSAAAPRARLVIAGEGPLREALRAQAASLGESIRFLGWRSDVFNLLADCDVLVVPSLWEGFGLVTLEAMALSKPVIASRVSALPEIVADGETGLLVSPGDSGALVEALTRVLTDPAQAKALGERGRARLETEFTVKRMARQHAAVYKEAASRVPEFRA